MTWSARITRKDGTNPTREGAQGPDYSACMSCKHGQYDHETGHPEGGGYAKIQPCFLPKVAGNVGSLLACVDVGADGHMASGEAVLKCNGYEALEAPAP